MRNLLVGLFSLLLCTCAVHAETRVAVVFDEHCGSCAASLSPGVLQRAYVVLSGWSESSHCVGCSLREVDFKVEGIPTDWSVSYAATEVATFASDPLAAGGAKIQFDPGVDVSDCFLLYTLELVPSQTTTPQIAVVKHPIHNCSSLGGLGGPFWGECPDAGASLVCGGECTRSSVANTSGAPCQPTRISAQFWSEIRRLYR